MHLRRALVGRLVPPVVLLLAVAAVLSGPSTRFGQCGDSPPRGPKANEHLYAGIELGGTGIKAAIVAKPVAKTPSLAPQNVGLASALASDGEGHKRFTTAAVDRTATIINDYKHKLADLHVPADHILLAISSGLSAAADAKGGTAAIAELRTALQAKTGLEAIVIDGDKEARLTFVGIVPDAADRPSSLAIDVGGGNTKIATATSQGAVPYGARTLSDGREHAKGPDSVDEKALRALDALFQKIAVGPGSMQHVYLSGGPAYITAMYLYPAELAREPKGLHKLTSAEIHEFSEALKGAESIDALFGPKLSALKGANNVTAADKLKKAAGIYELPKLRAGVWLLDEAIRRTASPVVVFNGDGEVAWLRGLVEETGKARP